MHTSLESWRASPVVRGAVRTGGHLRELANNCQRSFSCQKVRTSTVFMRPSKRPVRPWQIDQRMDAVRASFTSSSGGRRSIFAVMNGGSGKDMDGLQIQGAVIHPGYCTAVCRGQWTERPLETKPPFTKVWRSSPKTFC